MPIIMVHMIEFSHDLKHTVQNFLLTVDKNFNNNKEEDNKKNTRLSNVN